LNLIKFAKYFSYIFVPTTFTVWLFIFASLSFQIHPTIPIILSLLLTFIIPILVFIYLKNRGNIKDYDASIKEERTSLYVIGIILCLIGFIISLLSNYSVNFTVLWFIYIINSIFLIIINKYWKISAHLIGVSAPIAAFYYWGSFNAVILLILSLILAWARLKLKMHSVLQIIAGFLFGILLTYLQLKIFIG